MIGRRLDGFERFVGHSLEDSFVEIRLPFGRTDASPAEIAAAVDLDEAAANLGNIGVDDAKERVRLFAEEVPVLLSWLEENGRDYPWRRTTEPWDVYIAEVLLQKTRGDVVRRVYADFMDRYPDPESLSAAASEEIQSQVETLGFGSQRTRTLLDAAEIFTDEYHGEIPMDVGGLRKPWGVGEYTARAVQVFARGESYGLVDANIARVYERVFGIEMPDQPHKSDEIYKLADALTPSDPGLCRAYNLALLDLGDAVCKPAGPLCEECPIDGACDYYDERPRVNTG